MSAPALTTTFTPPPQCTTDIWKLTWSTDNLIYGLLGGEGISTCLPPNYKTTSNFFYSPGVHCPAGWETACSSSQVVGSETATVVTCCPEGYQCQTKTAGGWPWESFMLGCTQPCTGREVHSYTATGGRRTTETCGPGGGNNAYSIQIRFRQADIGATTTTSSSTTGTATPNPSRSTPTTESTPTTDAARNTATSSPSDSGGMSAGVKAGIGVGSVFGIALIGAILYLAYVIRQRDKNKNPYGGINSSDMQSPPIIYASKGTDESSYMPHNQMTYELGHTPLQPQELPAIAK